MKVNKIIMELSHLLTKNSPYKVNTRYLDREARQVLHKDKVRFRLSMESVLDGILYINLENPEKEWMCPVFLNKLGYYDKNQSKRPKSCKEMIHPNDLQSAINHLKKHLENPQKEYNQDVRYVKNDGSIIWFRCRGMAIRNKKGKAIRMLSLHQDITNIKINELKFQQLFESSEESKNLKEQLISIISHDIRSKVSGISTAVGLFENSMKKDCTKKNIEKGIDLIKTTTSTTMALIDELNLWGNMVSGKTSFNPISFKLSFQLFEKVIEYLTEKLTAKNINLQFKTMDEPIVFADTTLIEVVIRNLISNAIKFSHKGGKIEIYLHEFSENNQSLLLKKITIPGNLPFKHSCMALISIKDYGTGMSKDIKEQLLLDTPAISSPGTDNEKGTGLGLLICKEIIEKHNGKIWFETEENKGSSFYFILPLYKSLNKKQQLYYEKV